MNNTSAQGMSLSFVVIAALGLIVLVILSVIIARNFEGFTEDTDSVKRDFGPDSCEIPGSGRTCVNGLSCPSGQVHRREYDLSCNPDDEINNICCERS
jgi:hypothetical protein